MIIVRVTGILVEDGRILLLDQDVDDRSWSLPGGRVEPGEPLGDALVREMREETGLDVRVERLLYVCDHLPVGGPHVVHMTFELSRVGGELGRLTEGVDTNRIRGVRFVPLDELTGLGFGSRFAELARAGWPGAGSYAGAKKNIGL